MKTISTVALSLAAWVGGAVAADALSLTSPDIKEGGTIDLEQVFSDCKGKNISPALTWSGAPENTKSFALDLYDSDAPAGFWHWVVFNIPVATTSLAKGAGDPKSAAAPTGAIQGRTDFGFAGYGGPCPPPGPAHHYIFTVYAVDVDKLGAGENATAAVVGIKLHHHTIAKASLTALYGQ